MMSPLARTRLGDASAVRQPLLSLRGSEGILAAYAGSQIAHAGTGSPCRPPLQKISNSGAKYRRYEAGVRQVAVATPRPLRSWSPMINLMPHGPQEKWGTNASHPVRDTL